jgi:CRISPR-associated endonuclease Csn1
MKKILGLDLGTNSIGWALVEIDHEKSVVKIIGLGSRILPMDAGEIKDFESSGKIKSSAAQRRESRTPRRMNERFILRRDRLHLVLNLLNALPKHYKIEIDFTNEKGEKSGQFKSNREPKLAYLPKSKGSKAEFLFKDSYQKMLDELGIENKRHNRIPYDWTLYYLRQKALKSEITLEELAWVLLSYNQKRGYEKIEVENKSEKENENIDELDLRVKNVTELSDKEKKKYFRVELDSIDNFTYNEYSDVQMTFKDDLKEVKIISKIDETETIKSSEYTVVDIFPLKIEEVKYEKQDGKHKYTLIFDNGWEEVKQPKNYTFRYEKAKGKEYEYIVETVYDEKGNIKLIQGKPRKLRDPDFGDSSNDWTLLKKKTEKEALAFNYDNGYRNEKNEPRKYISTKIYDILKKDALCGNRTKIIGGMFQVVDRDFYRAELNQIIETQKQFHNELKSKELFEQCVNTLYPKNESHAKILLANKTAIQHLLVEDVLLYQRPLKSKKSEISNCKYEIQRWVDVLDKNGNPIEGVDKETGEIKQKKQPIYLKAVSTSHPIFQEFRIWDKLHNLRLIQIEKEINGKLETNVDVTDDYFTPDTYQKLFELLNNQKTLSQSKLIEFLKPKFKEKKEDYKNFVWNFPEDEEFKGNETRASFAFRFKHCGFTEYANFLTQQKELDLWHYLYSVNYKERTANNNKSVTTFFNRYLEDSNVAYEAKEKIIKDFANYPKFASKYCAYSEKALKKLLPLIRLADKNSADHWTNEQSYTKWQQTLEGRKAEILKRLKTIDFSVENIDFSNAVSNDTSNGNLPFPKGLFNAFKLVEKAEDFTKLNLTQASYLVYGRHSELAQAIHWNSPQEIRDKLHQELKQHSLNNPIAEKVILEMMQVVADIWDYYGEGKEKFFSKIHLEIGRELKKSAKEKEAITKNQTENKKQNNRLRQTLIEFLQQSPYNAIPQNNDHFERLKIVEEGAEHRKNTDKKFFENKPYSKKDIEDILKKPTITQADFEKYKLWIEQGYRSPYTNKMIKLTDLFNGNKYNVDHVFPQASVTNDSLSNKVVCEREINKLKTNQTGRAFINNPQQRKVYCAAHNSEVEIVDEETYVSIVKIQFSGTKRFILLSKEIPKGFTNSQLNNTRHIARKAMELLSHIVREEGEVEFRSKNVLPVTGEITNKLKKAWRLDQVWKELVAPRFIRMNELTQSKLFGQWQTSNQGQEYFDCKLDNTILEKNESYDIKRIDHRHHALDALIVALCTEDHVNYINNINADAKSVSYGKQKQIEKYRETLKKKIKFSQPKKEDPKEKDWFYMLPGEIRKQDAGNSSRETLLEKMYFYKDSAFEKDYRKMVLSALQNTIVTFKQNLRVINKRVNYYQAEPNTKKRKAQAPQTFKDLENSQNKYNWGIRRSLGKGTLYGKIDIGERENKQLLKNVDFFYANIDAISNRDLRAEIQAIKKESVSADDFKRKLKGKFKNISVECIAYKAASRYNNSLESFSSDKIISITDKVYSVTDTGIQKILFNHLKQFDTVELPFVEALQYYDAVLEKQEIEAIINDSETEFQSIHDFTAFLQFNKYTYKKVDYSILNVFIEQVSGRDFRSEERFKNNITKHHEIAFTPEEIERMNDSENLKRLNDGRNHKPIRKVRTYTGFGNEKRISNDAFSNKYKQFVKVDKGTNFYIAIYEIKDKSKISRNNPIRLFKEINLFDLIEYQKYTNTRNLPIEENVYSENGEIYTFLFTLTQNDVVEVNTEQGGGIYAFNRFTGSDVYFRPINHSSEIDKCEVDLKINSRTRKLGGSQINETTSFNGEQIKNICIKLNIDRLGNIYSVKKKPINVAAKQQNTLSEPETLYQKRTLKMFNSFDEMENEQLAYYASLSPEALLKNLKHLNLGVFGYKDETQFALPDRKIKFDEK